MPRSSSMLLLHLIFHETLAQFGFDEDKFGLPSAESTYGSARPFKLYQSNVHKPRGPPASVESSQIATQTTVELLKRLPHQTTPPSQVNTPPLTHPIGKAGHVLESTLRTLVADIDRLNTVFRGHSYEHVVAALMRYYSQHSHGENRTRLPGAYAAARSEIQVNANIAVAMFESDMMLTLDQVNTVTNRRHRRKAIRDISRRWDTQIAYKFLSNDAKWKKTIKRTLHFYEANTCLRFIENGIGKDMMLFNRGAGCYSGVGKMGGLQEVSLGSGCDTMGIAAHEIGHALGLWHEQTRTDRDAYIRINHKNIAQGYEGTFQKHPFSQSDDFGVPYDYGSVMHYASNSFSVSFGADTITTLQPQFSSTIGNRFAPTFYDVKTLNEMYCKKRCRPLPCENEGYTNPNSCSSCICPMGLGGTYCDHLAPSSCGRELTATSSWQTLSYSGTGACYWRITSKNGGRIRFKVLHVRFSCAISCMDFLEIKYGASLAATGARMCCGSTVSQGTSKGSSVIIISRASETSQFLLEYINEDGASIAFTEFKQALSNLGETQQWGAWGAWTDCSDTCGACGTRSRVRQCLHGHCSGQSLQLLHCNTSACSRQTLLPIWLRGNHNWTKMELWCCEPHILRGNVCVYA